eukprot:TRINITY_DN1043_c0_g1_i1.p1 TRINITY_DN1043_c0_g1~~TRINITY_DN1043_c0_g1_i1.p1  ORF type:complete len:212 (-),score=49.99 TRINITY_DN1043_c0_g1_i1:130-765(-)
MAFLFGAKPPDPAELVRNWKRQVLQETRRIERAIRDIEHSELKGKQEVKKLLKSGDEGSAKILVREIVRGRKEITRLYNSKAHLHSISLSLQANLATLRTTKSLAKSTQVMAAMNNLMKVPQLQETVMTMGREMERAGFIDSMIEDALADDVEDEEAEEEVEKVYTEIVGSLLSEGKKAPSTSLVEKKEREKQKNDMINQLSALKVPDEAM